MEERTSSLASSLTLTAPRQELDGQRLAFLAEHAARKFAACDFQRGERAREVAATKCFARASEHQSLRA